MARKKIYEINKYSENVLALNESVDPADEFSREINTMFKTDDVRRVMQAFYDQCDENAKAILLDVVREEFLNKFAAPEGSGPGGEEGGEAPEGEGGILDDGGSDGDFDFELDGADLGGDDMLEDGGSDENPDEGGEPAPEGDGGEPAPEEGGEPAGDPFMVGQEGGSPEDQQQTGNNPFFESARDRMRRRSLNERFMRVRKPRNRKEAEMLSKRILESFKD